MKILAPILLLATLAAASPAVSLVERAGSLVEKAASLVQREGCPTTTEVSTQKKGSGDPHQNFVFKQVSGTTDCTNNPDGSAAVTKGQTVGWSLSAGISQYVSGGFDISETVTTGYTNSFGCKTNTKSLKGDLCVFERIQMTAFTVEHRTCINSCTSNCGPWKGADILYAPNTQQASCYYDNHQVGLPCKELGAEHHIDTGPKGGPSLLSCQPSHA